MKLIESIDDNFKIDIYLSFDKDLSYDDKYQVYVDNEFQDKKMLLKLSDYINLDRIDFIIRYYDSGLYIDEVLTTIEKEFNLYDKKVFEKISKELEKDRYNYSDNYRVAIENGKFNKIYNHRRARGCCGFYDEKFLIKDKVVLVGYNCGH